MMLKRTSNLTKLNCRKGLEFWFSLKESLKPIGRRKEKGKRIEEVLYRKSAPKYLHKIWKVKSEIKEK